MFQGSKAPLAAALVLALMVPVTVEAVPSITVNFNLATAQRLVDSLLKVGEIRAALKDGETLGIKFTDSPADVYSGKITASGATMSETRSAAKPTHEIAMSGAAGVTLANAYDPANTAKLLLKGGYVGLTSSRPSVQAGFNALVKTPADARLTSYDPKLGDTITHGGCTGTLSASATDGYFQVRLCRADYVVNALGGVNGKIVNVELADVCATSSEGDLVRCADSAFTLHALSGGDQEVIRATCTAAYGAEPSTHPEGDFWYIRVSTCINANLRGWA